MIDLRRLRHALALSRERNFARAAAALHITQPALTRSIQSLEESLGARLFDRGPRFVEPTALGELVLKHARGLELSAQDLERELHLAKGMETGELSIGVGPFGAASIVGLAIGRLTRLYPRLRTRVLIAPWQELPMRIRAREADLMVSDVSEAAGQEDLEIVPLMPHRGFVVCRPEHPLTRLARVTVADALRFPLVAPNMPQVAVDRLMQLMPAADRPQTTASGLFAVTCDSASMLMAILAESDAISIMGRFMVDNELKAGTLAMIPGVDLGVQGQLGVSRLRGRSLSAPAEAFLEILIELDRAIGAMEPSLPAAGVNRARKSPSTAVKKKRNSSRH